MDTTNLKPLVEDLSDNIDDLEESLAPLLNTALSASTSKLPLLDKAKLYVLTTYAIESLLFSYLKLNGVDAKNHTIFQELIRVKHYFDKLKTAETGPVKPTTRLDKDAAGRFIKAGLAGNDEYDKQRKELQEREKAGAKRKFEDMGERVGSHLRFENTAKKLRGDDEELLAKEAESQDSDDEVEGAAEQSTGESSGKRKRPTAADMNKPEKKSKKKRSKLEATDTTSSPNPTNTETILPKKQKSSKPPRGASEAFKALLEGPIAKEEDSSQKDKKKKRKSRGEKN